MNNACILSGSYDPITLGHLDLIQRSCKLFSKVVVAILESDSKRGMFDLSEREHMAKLATVDMPQVEVVTSSGMLVDLAKTMGIGTIVRGMRSSIDFAYENQMATINYLLDSGVETIFMISRFPHLTSSAVREIIHYGGDFSKFVDPSTEKEIKTILKKRGK